MGEDAVYLFLCYLIFGITLLIFISRSKNRLKTAGINIIVALVYNAFFLYNLEFQNTGGAGLVWLVYLMIAIGLHWLINLAGLVLTFTGKKT